jgi:hypothetical protein
MTPVKFDPSNVDLAQIPDLLDKIKAQIKKIKNPKADTENLKTDFTGFGNLNCITNTRNLLKAASVVIAKEKAWIEACATLSLPIQKHPFTLDGNTKQQWIDIISNRISLVENGKKLTKLIELEKTLNDCLTEEEKKKRRLVDAADILLSLGDD